MPGQCLLYYITDRTQFPGDENSRRRALLDKIAKATLGGVDYIQLREKNLAVRDLELLAEQVVSVVRKQSRGTVGEEQAATRLLINSRTDVALAAGADGVHLRSEDISVTAVRSIWSKATDHLAQTGSKCVPQDPIVAVSCHTADEILSAEKEGADFAVFAPVFEKRDRRESTPAGLVALQEACRASIPVLALGGVTLENARSCLDAGAAGIAAIRLFQENKIEDVVRCLRSD